MQKEHNERVTFKFTPCKAPDPCREYEDYDPCESNDDITDKDLAVLLKEEQAKLQREKELAEAELRKQQQQNQQQQGRETGKSSDGGELNAGADGKGADENRNCHRVRKQVCRKLMKNPFFTNRLSFSSDLPPPPPFPPPQFFPLVDENDSKSKICPKRRKKCKKKIRDWDRDETEEEEQEGGQEEKKEEDTGELECACMYEDECLEEDNPLCRAKKGRRKCKKPEKFPCRKKGSDVSISLQPRHIPALQRDLPPTSPQDIPEVERQIMMACGKDCEPECKKKKKCKKKSEKPIEE